MERQKMEMQHLSENHALVRLSPWLPLNRFSHTNFFHLFQAIAQLQKRHSMQSKAYDREMKKLSIKDETVQEAFRQNAAKDDTLRDIQDRKNTVDKRTAKKLEKIEKEALTEARQSVVLNGAWRQHGEGGGCVF